MINHHVHTVTVVLINTTDQSSLSTKQNVFLLYLQTASYFCPKYLLSSSFRAISRVDTQILTIYALHTFIVNLLEYIITY